MASRRSCRAGRISFVSEPSFEEDSSGNATASRLHVGRFLRYALACRQHFMLPASSPDLRLLASLHVEVAAVAILGAGMCASLPLDSDFDLQVIGGWTVPLERNYVVLILANSICRYALKKEAFRKSWFKTPKSNTRCVACVCARALAPR
eukprot:s2050_g6.t1